MSVEPVPGADAFVVRIPSLGSAVVAEAACGDEPCRIALTIDAPLPVCDLVVHARRGATEGPASAAVHVWADAATTPDPCG